MRIRYVIVLCLVSCIAGCVGTFIFTNRCNRAQSQRIEELERAAEELQSRYDSDNRRLLELGERAREYAEAMGQALERDGRCIEDTTSLVRALRTQMQNLRDFYRDCSSLVSDNGNDNRSGGK